MTNNTKISSQGITFTANAVTVMREAAASYKKEGYHVIWAASFDKRGEPDVSIGGGDEIGPPAIADKIEDIQFYWYALPHDFEMLKKYCVDKEWDKKSRVILLSSPKSQP